MNLWYGVKLRQGNEDFGILHEPTDHEQTFRKACDLGVSIYMRSVACLIDGASEESLVSDILRSRIDMFGIEDRILYTGEQADNNDILMNPNLFI